MAPGMKHWLVLVGAGFALAAVWALPPGVLELGDRTPRPHASLRYEALSRDLTASYATLKRLRWIDSLGALATASADPVEVVAPSHVDASQLAELERRLDESVRRPRREGMRILYAYQDIRHGHDPAIRSDERGRTEIYAGRRNGVDFCVKVVVTGNPISAVRSHVDALRTGSRWFSDLGTCRLYARHGPPGPSILAWLQRGGTTYASFEPPDPSHEEWLGPHRWGRRMLFGTSTVAFGRSLPLERCLAGYEPACAALFLEPATSDPVLERDARAARRASALSINERRSTFLGQGAYLLGDLEASFGPDAFERFWTSGADVGLAFEGAFGVAPGAWVASWVDSVIGIDPPGPELAGSGSTLPIVLTLGLFATIAILQARRRGAR